MMVEFQAFLLFLGAALLVAITPEPGMFYVAARTFAGGRPHGLASAWAPVLAVCVCYCRGGRDLCVRHGDCRSLHSAQARRSLLSDLAWVKPWTEATIVDPVGVEIVGVGRAYWRDIIVEMLNSKTGAFFSPSPATLDPADRCRPAVRHPWDRFRCSQHCRQCDRDLLGRHSMSGPGQAAVCRPQNATGIWCSDVHVGIFTSSFTSSCAAGRLITLRAILSTAACFPMLQHNLSADCSGTTTAFMYPGAHTSFASGRASLSRVDVRHVGDRCASSP